MVKPFAALSAARLLMALALGCVVNASYAVDGIRYTGGGYRQDFDSLPATGTFSLTGEGPYDLANSPISARGAAGWSFARTGGSKPVALFSVGDGHGTGGAVYSFGVSGAADRALGTQQSGSNVSTIGALFLNGTAATITEVTLSFVGEQWRKGGSATQDRLIFEYGVGNASIVAGTFAEVPALDFPSPVFGAGAGELDGNNPSNRTAVKATISGLAWKPGEPLAIRWRDLNVPGSDDGLAIDDVTFSTPVAATSSTVVPTTVTAIHTIQGSGAASELVGQLVTVEGLVVASFQGPGRLGGYYLEAPKAAQDADDATSEGIYVADQQNITTAGDLVTVSGTVAEAGNGPATQTQLGSVVRFAKLSSGNVVPAPVAVTLPFASATFAERYEGMLISLPQTLTVSETYDFGRYGELVLSNGRLLIPTNVVAPGAAAQSRMAANRLNRIVLDDGRTAAYPEPTPYLSSGDPATATRRSGSTTSNVKGVLNQRARAYVLEPTVVPTFVDANPRGAAPNPGGSLHVAIGNVLNFFNGDGAGGGFPTPRGADNFAEYQRQRAKIVAGILSLRPDIMGLTEVENDGFGPASAIQDLVNGLNVSPLPGAHYAFVNVGAAGLGTDRITCGFIYNTATVALVGATAVNLDPVFNRPPIAQTFRELATGGKLTVSINHFKSKGSGPGAGPDADRGDGQGAWSATRTSQANVLTQWLATHPTGDADPDILILGDLNAYAKEDPLMAIAKAGYVNLTERFEGEAGYSFVFNGEAGHLDHALASPTLAAQTVGAKTWAANSDEPMYFDYNTENKSPAQQAINAGTPYRYSDHDPVIVGLNLKP